MINRRNHIKDERFDYIKCKTTEVKKNLINKKQAGETSTQIYLSIF